MMKKNNVLMTLLVLALFAGVLMLIISLTHPAPVAGPQDQPVTTTTVWPSEQVRVETINQKDSVYQINVSYPIAQSEAVTAYFRTFVENVITEFKAETVWATESEGAVAQNLTLDIAFVRTKTDTVDNYVFSVSSYAGGAHGIQSTKTFAFSPEGKPVTLSDVFTNGEKGLETIAPYVQKELLKLSFTEKDWVMDGTKPEPLNYQSFIVSPEGITFIFDPYQVAYYAAGQQQVTVPVSAFKAIANKTIFAQ